MKTNLKPTSAVIFLSLALLFFLRKEAISQNIGINGTGAFAHPSALLDVDAATTPSLGILIPRISLQAINLASPVTSPATSLLVYNTVSASTGTNAVSPGYYYWDGTKWVRFAYNASGSSSLDWNTLGNAGTVDGTNFIGTTDNVPFNIRVNNQKAGRLDQTLGNTFYGVTAGNANTTGNVNEAIGQAALLSNTTGSVNTSVGFATLHDNVSGSENQAFGYEALFYNVSGNQNTAVGTYALHFNTASRNVALGHQSMYNNTSGTNNTSSGYQSLFSNTTGGRNTANGFQALYSNTTASKNTSMGYNSMYSNTIGGGNAAFGFNTLYSNTTGTANIAIGSNALYSNNIGVDNISIGENGLYYNTTGNANTSIGSNSTFSNTTGSNNTAMGYQALRTNATGSLNVAVGSDALYYNISGRYNTAVGSEALMNSTTINEATAIGGKALKNNTTGIVNTAVGGEALLNNTTGSSNTAVGHSSLRLNNGNRNSALGYLSLTTNAIGSDNTAVGYQALRKSTSPNGNTAVGASALVENTLGANNTALGANASFSNTIGNENVSVGTNALSYNQSGSANVAVGYNSLFSSPASTFSYNTAVGWKSLEINTANYNAAFGAQAMKNNVGGTYNSAFGTNSLFSNNSGNNNSSIGFESMLSNSTGSENTALGYHSLADNASGSNNTAIGRTSLEHSLGNNNTGLGYYSGITNTNGFNNTFIGANADATIGTFTNATAIGYNSKVAASNALILGGTGTDLVKVGIGINSPLYDLHVVNSKNAQMGQWLQNGDATGSLASSILLVGQGSNKYGYLAYHNDSYNNSSFPGLKPNMTLLYGTQDLALSAGSSLNDITFGNSVMSNVYMTIKGGGNVGINTTAPTEKLEVQGSVKIVDGTQGAGKVLTSDANGKASWQVSSGSLISSQSLPAQSIPPTATTILSGFSFTAPSQSDYRIEFRCWNTFTGASSPADVAQHVRLLKNGAPVDEYEHYTLLGSTRNTTFSIILHASNCNVGDILTLDLRPGIAAGATAIQFNTSNPWTTSKVLVFPE